MSKLNTPDPELHEYLLHRIGKAHLRRRIGVEAEHMADRFGQGRTFFHIENWNAAAIIIKLALQLTGLAARGRANVLNLQLRHNEVVLPHLPEIFDGYTLLQLSDLHLDSLDAFPEVLAEKISELEFDICVLTGDYRFLTHGPHHNAMLGLERLRRDITADMYAILGNHDPVAMVPPIEAMGIRLLLNENIPLQRNGERL